MISSVCISDKITYNTPGVHMHSWICCRLQIFISTAVQLEGCLPGKHQQTPRAEGKEGASGGATSQPIQPRKPALVDGDREGKTARTGVLLSSITDSLKYKRHRLGFKALSTWQLEGPGSLSITAIITAGDRAQQN